MHVTRQILLLSAALAMASCATVNAPSRKVVAAATLLDADGQVVGNATIGATGERLNLQLDVQGLSEGLHGAHLHAVGRCAPRDFSSAGGHLNPDGHMHGQLNPQGAHLGDLANITVAAGGQGALVQELAGSRAVLEQALFDTDGTAIVIHAGADDLRTDPSGNSGSRIACGVFTRVR